MRTGGQGEGDPGRVHRRAVRRLLGRHLRHTWTAARLTEVPTVVDAGIRAASRDRHAFDALVEIGLGDGRITPRLAAGIALALPARPQTSSTVHHARRS